MKIGEKIWNYGTGAVEPKAGNWRLPVEALTTETKMWIQGVCFREPAPGPQSLRVGNGGGRGQRRSSRGRATDVGVDAGHNSLD